MSVEEESKKKEETQVEVASGEINSLKLRETFFPEALIDVEFDCNEITQDYNKQKKAVQEVITKLKRLTYAEPFKKPVDPIALQIPDYMEKIKYPIDISAIERKLKQDEYLEKDGMLNFAMFKSDFELMFNNCFIYNQPGSDVFLYGENLKTSFANYLQKANTVLLQQRTEVETGRTYTTGKTVTERNEILNLNQNQKVVGITKNNIITEIIKPKYSSYVWPFLKPVSPEDVPTYYDVIKNPMDLSEIRKRAIDTTYAVENLIRDLYLMLSNCFLFNDEDSVVYKCGEKLLNLVVAMIKSKIVDQRSAEQEESSQNIDKGKKRKRSDTKKEQKWVESKAEAQNENMHKDKFTKDKSVNKIKEIKLELARIVKQLKTIQQYEYPKEELDLICVRLNSLEEKQMQRVAEIIEEDFPEIIDACTYKETGSDYVEIDMRLLDNDTIEKIKTYLVEIEKDVLVSSD